MAYGNSSVLAQEAPVMIAEKRKLFFLFWTVYLIVSH